MLKNISLLCLLCIISYGTKLYTQEIVDKVPTNLAIRFKNNSSQKIHALFIYTPDFSNVFNTGTWSEQSLKTLTSIANICATLYDEKQAQKAAQAAEIETNPTQQQPSQPQKIKLSTVTWVKAAENITNMLVGIVTQPAVILVRP